MRHTIAREDDACYRTEAVAKQEQNLDMLVAGEQENALAYIGDAGSIVNE
jgi:hypothetical protein